MSYNLTNIPGNFLTDASSIEAWDFEQVDGSGNFPGLFVPSRVLTITGAGAEPIQRVAGHRGRGIYQPAGCDQYLSTAYDDSYNALQNLENWLAVSVWWKPLLTATQTGFGISNGSGSQWSVEDLAYLIPYLRDSTGLVEASIETAEATQGEVFYHGIFQFYYDGAGFGCDLKSRVNGVDHNTVSGTPTLLTPNFSAIPFVLGSLGGVVFDSVVWDSLLFWKSSVAALDSTSMDALYNNGAGIDFVPGGRNRLLKLVGAGIV